MAEQHESPSQRLERLARQLDRLSDELTATVEQIREQEDLGDEPPAAGDRRGG